MKLQIINFTATTTKTKGYQSPKKTGINLLLGQHNKLEKGLIGSTERCAYLSSCCGGIIGQN